MKLNIPSMKKTEGSATGSRGPEDNKPDDLELVLQFDHVHTINPIEYITSASAFGEDHEGQNTPKLVEDRTVAPAKTHSSTKGKANRPAKA